jgi:hypothetical protein
MEKHNLSQALEKCQLGEVIGSKDEKLDTPGWFDF